MATWSSNPSVSHTGGTFIFPENTGTTPISYTISYTDDNGCTASTTCTVPSGSTCQPATSCTCSEANVSVSTTDLALDWQSGATGVFTFTASCDVDVSVRRDSVLNIYITSARTGNVTSVTAITQSSLSQGGRTSFIDIRDANDNLCQGIKVIQYGREKELSKTVNLSVNANGYNMYFNTLVVEIYLIPKNGGTSVQLLNERFILSLCDNRYEWKNSFSKEITLTGTYLDSLSDYNFYVDVSNCIFKAKASPEREVSDCGSTNPSVNPSLSYMYGVGSGGVTMSQNHTFNVSLSSENDIGNNITISLVKAN